MGIVYPDISIKIVRNLIVKFCKVFVRPREIPTILIGKLMTFLWGEIYVFKTFC